MEIFTKTTLLSSLFLSFGVTNCVVEAGYFFPWGWSSHEEDSPGIWQRIWQRWSMADNPDETLEWPDRNLKRYFLRMKALHERGEINKLEFARSVICVFRNWATEEKGLVDILCERCGISVDDETRIALIVHCLSDLSLGDVPILALNISEDFINVIDASKDLCTDPYPDFCQAVMAANNLEEMAKIFDQFGSPDQFGRGLIDNPEVIAKQSRIYRKAAIFRADVPRSVLNLTIGGKKVTIPRTIFESFAKHNISTQDVFQLVLDYFQAPEEEGGGGLDEVNAFYVLKQVVLAYRGQNGTAEGVFLIGIPLGCVSGRNLSLKCGGVEINMRFEKINDLCWTLVEKTEYSPILGIKNAQAEGKLIIFEVRFKFPGDSKVRTQLPITSTRIFSADEEIIKWRCPFRENPPRKVILYGGCTSTDTH
jgi:hypothetical protein